MAKSIAGNSSMLGPFMPEVRTPGQQRNRQDASIATQQYLTCSLYDTTKKN